MKWLIVLWISDRNLVERQNKQYESIRESCEQAGHTIVCQRYVYSEEDYLLAEAIVKQLAGTESIKEFDFIAIAEGKLASEIAGRLSARLNRECLTDVCRITYKGEQPICYKTVYNGNMEAGFVVKKPLVVSLSHWKTDHKKQNSKTNNDSPIVMPQAILPVHIKERTLIQEGAGKNASDVLIATGKGIRSKADVERLRAFAGSKGYLFGVSRPVAMNGWAAIDEIIGVSGHIYEPEICLTIGVSGSAAFYAGIENSRWIASVNTDPRAAIIKMSDVSVIEDYANIWDHMEQFL